MSRLLIIILSFSCSCINPQGHFTELAAPQQSPHQNPLSINVLDVGQGAATAVVSPEGQVALIDAGKPFAGLSFILPWLRSREINELDWVLISHYDNDHLGGLLEVLLGEDQEWETDDDVTIAGSIWDRGGTPFNPTTWFEDYQSELAPRNLLSSVSLGQDLSVSDQVQVTVVLSAGNYLDGSQHHLNPDEENELSIAVLVEHGSFRYLTAGDLTGGGFSGNRETKDLESHLAEMIGPVDVLHLNHHGSRTSTNEAYLDLLQPKAVMISSGRNNDFGHPHPEVIERLDARGIPYYQTSQGTIEIRSDGEDFEIIQE